MPPGLRQPSSSRCRATNRKRRSSESEGAASGGPFVVSIPRVSALELAVDLDRRRRVSDLLTVRQVEGRERATGRSPGPLLTRTEEPTVVVVPAAGPIRMASASHQDAVL